jgi:TPR repeat protein
MGQSYCEGDGVEKDYSKAIAWFRRASESGDQYAQVYLGAIYYRGLGVKRDYIEAAKWYHKAAVQGNKTAIKMLRVIAKKRRR